MASRHITGPHDGEIFTRTAIRTKRINVRPKIMRGGTRL